MKPNEARELSVDELHERVAKHREDLLDLRVQSTVGQVPNTKIIRTKKRDIARLLTVANEKANEKSRIA